MRWVEQGGQTKWEKVSPVYLEKQMQNVMFGGGTGGEKYKEGKEAVVKMKRFWWISETK